MKKTLHKNSIRCLICLGFTFGVTLVVGFLTAPVYANAFFYLTKGIVLSFCAFLSIDVLRWIDRAFLSEGKTQTKAQEIGWTVAILLFIVYFLWRRWDRFSLWHIWMVAIVGTILLIGLLIRLLGWWDKDCVRWITWTACCAIVSVGVLGTIILFKPLTIEETTELIHIETCDESFAFHHIDSSKKAESPLGYYILSPKQEDGGFSYGTGRAVLYFGEGKEKWRTAEPGSKVKEPVEEISLDGTLFTYKGTTWDVSQLDGSEYSKLVYNLSEYWQIGKHILVVGSMGKNADFYGVFNTETQLFEKALAAAHLIYRNEDVETIIYSFGDSIYDYEGDLILGPELGERDYIYDLTFDEAGTQLIVSIANELTDEAPREMRISLF